MSDIPTISDSRYGMDLAAVELQKLREKLLLNPQESRYNKRCFVDALRAIKKDNGENKYISDALLNNDVKSNLLNIARLIRNNEWRAAYITKDDEELILEMAARITGSEA